MTTTQAKPRTTRKSPSRRSAGAGFEMSQKQFAALVKKYQGERNAGLGAADTGRTRADWSMSGLNPNSFDLRTITNRALRAYYNNCWLRAATKVMCTNIIGAKGLRPQPKIADKKVVAELVSAWDLFNDHADNKFTFYQLEETMLISLVVTGNVFIVKQPPVADSPFDFSIKLLDTRHLDFSKDAFSKPGESRIKNGIEYNKANVPVRYHFVSEQSFDASDVIHCYYQDLAMSEIGCSWFTPALPMLYDIEMLLTYQVLSSRLSSGIALWVKPSADDGFPEDATGPIIPASPLSIYRTEYEPKVIEGSSRVEKEVIPLIDQCLQAISASIGVSKAAVTRDSKGETFSGGRLRNLQDELQWSSYSRFFQKASLNDVWRRWFVPGAVAAGLVPNLKAAAFQKRRWEYTESYWVGQVPEYIDPLDMTRNNAEKRKNKLMTDKEFWDSKGRNYLDVYDQLATEKKERINRGIEDPSDLEEAVPTGSEKERQKERETERTDNA